MNNMDPEVRILASISQALQVEYSSEQREWEGSPFAWIKSRPSRQVGAIGEKLVAGWLASRDFNVSRSPDSAADRIIEDKRVEIKFSTRWASGVYRFQQIRDQEYELVICLGVSPFSAHCWVIPKSDIIRLWKEEQKISSQHGGAGNTETAWIDVRADSPLDWIAEYGGSLSDGISALSRITNFKVKKVREEFGEYGA